MQKLYLHGNQLSALPSGVFDKLTQLTILSLYDNQLSALPAGVFDRLINLKELYFSNNQLTSLPAGCFDKLTKLMTLSLHKQHLKNVPDSLYIDIIVQHCGQLNSDARNMDTFACLHSLCYSLHITAERECLTIEELASLPVGVFDRLAQLTGLDLSHNQFTALPAQVFDRLVNLQLLHLNNNQLKSVPRDRFDKRSQYYQQRSLLVR
uniref:Leucine-rich repeat-containing protein 15-like n=2 Tax=Petromyzon marinus TaxID=7757 RepID=A0AAJ7T9L5_PETMA|nr:leucine-rich repeat-containing protein 15-like [Petromyzon marinus]